MCVCVCVPGHQRLNIRVSLATCILFCIQYSRIITMTTKTLQANSSTWNGLRICILSFASDFVHSPLCWTLRVYNKFRPDSWVFLSLLQLLFCTILGSAAMLFKEHGLTIFGICLAYDVLIISRPQLTG